MAERPSSIVVQAWDQVKAGTLRAGGIRNERQREPGSLIGPCLRSRESEGFWRESLSHRLGVKPGVGVSSGCINNAGR